MEKTVQELKLIMREMILEIGELKERVTRLENTKKAETEPIMEKTKLDKIKMQGEGYDKLGAVYHEGYHVCPFAYGERRDGECLFCIAFMEKE